MRHRFVYSSTWELPFGRPLLGHKGISKALEMAIFKIVTLQSGQPMSRFFPPR
jgi:hypothetical protein